MTPVFGICLDKTVQDGWWLCRGSESYVSQNQTQVSIEREINDGGCKLLTDY